MSIIHRDLVFPPLIGCRPIRSCFCGGSQPLESSLVPSQPKWKYRHSCFGSFTSTPWSGQSWDYYWALTRHKWYGFSLFRVVYSFLTLYTELDFTERWVINDNWTYTADLTPFTHNIGPDTKALLVFYGIDTIANIVWGTRLCIYLEVLLFS